MSTDYYARLEQGRGPQPSTQMIKAIARGLRLDIDERDHLLRLAGHDAPLRSVRSDHVGPALMRVLDRLHDTPAMVVSYLAETLVQNQLATALFGDQTRHVGLPRSSVYRWFTDPAERRSTPADDHQRQSRLRVSNLRNTVSKNSSDPQPRALVSALLERSAEFTELWSRHEVVTPLDDHKTIIDDELGDIGVHCQVLHAQNQAQALLSVIGTQRLH